MLNKFDWLRRSRSGAELLATLDWIKSAECAALLDHEQSGTISSADELGPPHSALNGPCERCWIYPRTGKQHSSRYCPSCYAILGQASSLGNISRQAVVVWAKVNHLPAQLAESEGFYRDRILGTYVHDKSHFLLMMRRYELKNWLQELIIYHGTELKGAVQVFPTIGLGQQVGMGDLLCRIVHHETNLGMKNLRVRFYAAPHQVMRPHLRDQQGLLTFELSDFLSMLEMAAVFRTLLLPEEQEMLRALLDLTDPQEAQFYWGRFLARLSQKPRDMLQAWQIRNWTQEQVKLLYELVEYVDFY